MKSKTPLKVASREGLLFLARSVGPFSAGTRVVLGEDQVLKSEEPISVFGTLTKSATSTAKERQERVLLTVYHGDLVIRRPRSRTGS